MTFVTRAITLLACLIYVGPLNAQVENCRDGVDNDFDGLIDLNDPDCNCSPTDQDRGPELIPNGTLENLVTNCDPIRSGIECLRGNDWKTYYTNSSGPELLNRAPFASQYYGVGNATILLLNVNRGINNPPQNPFRSDGMAVELVAPLRVGARYRFTFNSAGGSSIDRENQLLLLANDSGPPLRWEACDGATYPGWTQLTQFSSTGRSTTASRFTARSFDFVASAAHTYLAMANACISSSVDDDFEQWGWTLDAFSLREIIDTILPPPLPTPTISTRSGDGCATDLNLLAQTNGTLAYQWYRDGIAIGGAGTSRFSLPVTDRDRGALQVRVADDTRCALSEIYVPPPLPDALDRVQFTTPDCGRIANIRTRIKPAFTDWYIRWENAAGDSIASGSFIDSLRPDTYTAVAVSPDGCQVSSRAVSVGSGFPPLEVDLDVLPANCNSDDPASEVVVNLVSGTAPLLLSIDGGETIPAEAVSLLPGTYQLSVQDVVGCTTDPITTVIPEQDTLSTVLSVTSGENRFENYEVRLSTNREPDALNITWSVPDSLMQVLEGGFLLAGSPPFTTVYTVSVTDITDGCQGSASVRLLVPLQRNIYFPSAFSPNGDGNNDIFRPFVGSAVARVGDLRVYNRWGAEVYRGIAWDGEGQASGTYVWQAEVEYIDGATELRRGTIVLIR